MMNILAMNTDSTRVHCVTHQHCILVFLFSTITVSVDIKFHTSFTSIVL